VRILERRALIGAVAVILAVGIARWQWLRGAEPAPDAESSAVHSLAEGEAERAAGPAPAEIPASAWAPATGGAEPPADEAASGFEPGWSDAPATETDAADARDALAGFSGPASPSPIYLLADAPGPDQLSTRVRGFDTGAPRALVLWRVEEGRRARLAEGFSTPDGALHFPDVLVPDELELVVTAAETGPAGTDESDSARIGARDLRPPDLAIRRSPSGALAIRVAAGGALGSVVFASAGGGEIARIPLPRNPSPSRRVFDVTLPAEPGPGELLVAHELPDGSRSAWRPHRFPAAAPAAPDAPSEGLPEGSERLAP
jgi:hypothetical protein